MFQNLQETLIQSYRKTLDQYFSSLDKKTQREICSSRTPCTRKQASLKPNEPIRGKKFQNAGGIIESEIKETQEERKSEETTRGINQEDKCTEDNMMSIKWGRGFSFQNSLFFPAGDESKGAVTPLHQFYDSKPFGFFNSRMSDSRFSAGLARQDSRTFPPSFFESNDSHL